MQLLVAAAGHGLHSRSDHGVVAGCTPRPTWDIFSAERPRDRQRQFHLEYLHQGFSPLDSDTDASCISCCTAHV